jgi:hypothetical protein
MHNSKTMILTRLIKIVDPDTFNVDDRKDKEI